MSVIWWTLYILGALTIVVAWIQVMALIGSYAKARRDAIENSGSGMTRKDIEALVRMEIKASLSKLEISRTIYPGLNDDFLKIQMKEDK